MVGFFKTTYDGVVRTRDVKRVIADEAIMQDGERLPLPISGEAAIERMQQTVIKAEPGWFIRVGHDVMRGEADPILVDEDEPIHAWRYDPAYDVLYPIVAGGQIKSIEFALIGGPDGRFRPHPAARSFKPAPIGYFAWGKAVLAYMRARRDQSLAEKALRAAREAMKGGA